MLETMTTKPTGSSTKGSLGWRHLAFPKLGKSSDKNSATGLVWRRKERESRTSTSEEGFLDDGTATEEVDQLWRPPVGAMMYWLWPVVVYSLPKRMHWMGNQENQPGGLHSSLPFGKTESIAPSPKPPSDLLPVTENGGIFFSSSRPA